MALPRARAKRDIDATAMILLRIHDLTPGNRDLAEQLAAVGIPFACVVDERNGHVDTAPWDKISLTVPACQALGLYCTDDMGWRTGDYGFYLARQKFPDVSRFWMIESDVRYGGDWADFFAMFKRTLDDLLVAGLREADRGWFWEYTMAARGVAVWRCMFPVVRLSSRAIDMLRLRRVTMSQDKRRQRDWPNDEAFVATVMQNTLLINCADINEFGSAVYDAETFVFHRAMDGDALQMRDGMLYHPVLYGADYRAKVARHAGREYHSLLWRRIRRRVVREVNRRT